MIGPTQNGEEINEYPLDRYPVGVLSPIPTGPELDAGDPDARNPQADSKPEASCNRYYNAPSSVGFSFLISSDAQLIISARGARYRHNMETEDASPKFKRHLYTRIELPPIEMVVHRLRGLRDYIWNNRAGIALQAVRYDGAVLCTLALYNRRVCPLAYAAVRALHNSCSRPKSAAKYRQADCWQCHATTVQG